MVDRDAGRQWIVRAGDPAGESEPAAGTLRRVGWAEWGVGSAGLGNGGAGGVGGSAESGDEFFCLRCRDSLCRLENQRLFLLGEFDNGGLVGGKFFSPGGGTGQ